MLIVKTERLLLVSGVTTPKIDVLSEVNLLQWIGQHTACIKRFDAYNNMLAIRNGEIMITPEAVTIRAFDSSGYKDLEDYGILIEQTLKTYLHCEVINPLYQAESLAIQYMLTKEKKQ